MFQQQQGGHCERSAVSESVQVSSGGISRVHIALGNVVIKDFGFYSMAVGKPMQKYKQGSDRI